MKIKILKCTDPNAWHRDRVGKEVDVEFMPEAKRTDPNERFIVKDWNWHWRRDLPPTTVIARDATITDKSGSLMADGYELGIAHGMVKKEQALIKEGILEDDAEEDDEAITLHL